MATLNKRTFLPGERIRVMVVDDSVVMRRLVTHAIEADPELEMVGSASNGVSALQRIPQFDPDIVTLDIEMPEMDGLSMLRQLRCDYPALRVIMCSSLTYRGAPATLDALALGADDYVTKVSSEGSLDQSIARFRSELTPKIKQFFHKRTPSAEPRPEAASVPVTSPPRLGARIRPKVVAIGVSTGGPTALGTILPEFPADFPLPILVVQHMPPLFTRFLAERLNSTCSLSVAEAIDGQPLVPGTILTAPGDYHMKHASTDGAVRVRLDQAPPLNSCRPAVDALFASVAEVFGGAAIAAVLTGMGQDGLRGVQTLKPLGAGILAQDEASSVVWGMPGAVVGAGLADCVLPLGGIVTEIVRRARRV
jgi:two-component system chemotaxis response regulator CheB